MSVEGVPVTIPPEKLAQLQADGLVVEADGLDHLVKTFGPQSAAQAVKEEIEKETYEGYKPIVFLDVECDTLVLMWAKERTDG